MATRNTDPVYRPPGRDPTTAGWPDRTIPETEESHHAAADAVRAATRFLGSQGFSPAAAGNLVAYQHGLAPVEGGWTADEIAPAPVSPLPRPANRLLSDQCSDPPSSTSGMPPNGWNAISASAG